MTKTLYFSELIIIQRIKEVKYFQHRLVNQR